MAVKVPRGVLNANPGNIRHAKDHWQGLSVVQPDPNFLTFDSPVWGIRAIARILLTYQDKYNCVTVEDFITRWAPPSENDTGAYVSAVCRAMGTIGGQFINVHEYDSMRKMVLGIIRQENGQQPYDAATIDEALRRAGIIPKQKAIAAELVSNPAPASIGAGGIAAAISALTATVAPIWDGLSALGINPTYLIWGVTGAAAIVAAWLAIDWLKRRRMG